MGVLNELYEESIEPDEFGALTLHYAARASIFEIVEMIFDRRVCCRHSGAFRCRSAARQPETDHSSATVARNFSCLRPNLNPDRQVP